MDDMHSCRNYKGLWHTSRNGQGMDMGTDIGIQANPQVVDGDINSNANPTSPTSQVLIFGVIPKKVLISPQSTTSTHKEAGGAPNKKLKTYAQNSINGATIIASILGKSSKIELLKMEANKEIALKMIELDRNVECQLQFLHNFLLELCDKSMVITIQ